MCQDFELAGATDTLKVSHVPALRECNLTASAIYYYCICYTFVDDQQVKHSVTVTTYLPKSLLKMAPTILNVLVSTFPGLELPSVLCIPVTSSSSISNFASKLSERLPAGLDDDLTLTSVSGKRIDPTSIARVSSLLLSTLNHNADFLSLRLSAPLLGGKGGFGSQLRAAGGRMSSRKKRAQGEQNSSNRNLDGRRLRTVNEAKALAEYLTVKPEMEKKEKEERRKRWEEVVETSERREEEIRSGKGKARIDGKWLEEKEEAESKTREAIAAAMQSGLLRQDARRLVQYEEDSEDESMSDDETETQGSSSKGTTPLSDTPQSAPRKVFGWDDEDDDMSDSDQEAPSKTSRQQEGKNPATT